MLRKLVLLPGLNQEELPVRWIRKNKRDYIRLSKKCCYQLSNLMAGICSHNVEVLDLFVGIGPDEIEPLLDNVLQDVSFPIQFQLMLFNLFLINFVFD